MPRKYPKKKGTKKPSGWRGRIRKYAGYADKASQALALASKVARMVNVEYKLFQAYASAAVSSSGTVARLCYPAQGDTVNLRDSDSIKLQRLSGRGYMQIHASSSATLVRLILFRDTHSNGTSYGISDILDSSVGTYVTNFKNQDNKFQTKFIYDKTYQLSQAGRQIISFDWNFKLYGHTHFTKGTTTYEDGGLWMILVSNEATNTPTVQYNLITTYTDN